MEWLEPEQILYCDTDSDCWFYDKNNPLNVNPRETPPPGARIGNALSCWEDDMKGQYATQFVGAGAKSYAYVLNDGTIKMKQKGITLDVANRAQITYDRFKAMVLNKDLIEKSRKPKEEKRVF